MKFLNDINPPKGVKRFFEWYCGDDVAEDLIGDMDELFYQNLSKMSSSKAKLKYFLQSLVLVNSYAIRNRKRKRKMKHRNTRFNTFDMYQSYAKIALRTLGRQKAFTFINIICLSIGMCVGLLALAACVDVTEVDDFFKDKQSIYRIITKVDDGSEKEIRACVSAPVIEKVKQEVTGIEKSVAIKKDFNPEIVQSENTTLPLRGYFADEKFFDVFSFEFIEGNSHTALRKPFTIVITESAAAKLFRFSEVVGKTLEVKDLGTFEITGIIKDYKRSHLDFEVIGSFATVDALEKQGTLPLTLNEWAPRTTYYSYVVIPNQENVAAVSAFLAEIKSPTQNDRISVQYELQPLTDIPTSDLSNEIGLSWGLIPLVIFCALSLLVLLPACFNYSNISIARALKRSKEIGLRKVSGGASRHVFFQMITETIIIALISLFGALLIYPFIRGEFTSMIVNGERTFDLEITPLTMSVFILFAVFTGILAGIFPATYFSKLNPIETLRNSSKSGTLSKISIRKGLIVAQFTLSMIFILGVAILAKQYRYALNYDLGFDKENILDIPVKDVDPQIFKNQLSKIPGIQSVSFSSTIPGNFAGTTAFIYINNGTDSIEVNEMYVDHAYLSNLKIQLLAGDGFQDEKFSNENSIIVNESFLRQFNISSPSQAIGQVFQISDTAILKVAGVVKDFNYMSFQSEIMPFFFRHEPSQLAYANVKIATADIEKTISDVEATWAGLTDQKFESRFLDDELEDSLVSFRSMIKIFGFLGFLAITISCLGLLAVVISSIETRTREIGVRKVMGASIAELAITLSRSFLTLIVISVMIAIPVSYFMFDKIFLTLFYYRDQIGFTEIGLSVLLLCLLIVAIIGSQLMRVARINPVDTLKIE